MNHSEGYVSLISGNTSIWFYSANYSSVKLIVRALYALSPYVNIGVRFTDKLNRTIILPIDSERSDFGEFKYAKITFENYNSTIYKHRVLASASNNGVKVLPTLRDLSGKHLIGNQSSDILYINDGFEFLSLGEKVKGGFYIRIS